MIKFKSEYIDLQENYEQEEKDWKLEISGLRVKLNRNQVENLQAKVEETADEASEEGNKREIEEEVEFENEDCESETGGDADDQEEEEIDENGAESEEEEGVEENDEDSDRGSEEGSEADFSDDLTTRAQVPKPPLLQIRDETFVQLLPKQSNLDGVEIQNEQITVAAELTELQVKLSTAQKIINKRRKKLKKDENMIMRLKAETRMLRNQQAMAKRLHNNKLQSTMSDLTDGLNSRIDASELIAYKDKVEEEIEAGESGIAGACAEEFTDDESGDGEEIEEGIGCEGDQVTASVKTDSTADVDKSSNEPEQTTTISDSPEIIELRESLSTAELIIKKQRKKLNQNKTQINKLTVKNRVLQTQQVTAKRCAQQQDDILKLTRANLELLELFENKRAGWKSDVHALKNEISKFQSTLLNSKDSGIKVLEPIAVEEVEEETAEAVEVESKIVDDGESEKVENELEDENDCEEEDQSESGSKYGCNDYDSDDSFDDDLTLDSKSFLSKNTNDFQF
ncbi:hypothetical protein HK098_006006 [Nowakowskiella sp. JEL0407]|nr:hypothetical protein HK098_006006 [Nowakowskiella sp. JEL0407]